MNEPLLRMEDVTRVFLTDEIETRALARVSLEIQRREFVAIVGPSGCGKSTLLSILGLLDAPTEGSYVLDGDEVAHLSPSERALVRNRDIGFIFQNFNLIGDLTVRENVELPLTYGSMRAAERSSRVAAAFECVGMTPRRNHFPAQLSGGEQQRVAVARAITGDPLLVLADEPTGNLDSANAAAVMELLRELHSNGTTICMVTHNEQFARVAQRTIKLFDGEIIDDPASQAVRSRTTSLRSRRN